MRELPSRRSAGTRLPSPGGPRSCPRASEGHRAGGQATGLSPWLTVAAPVSLPEAIASSRLRASTFAHILFPTPATVPPARFYSSAPCGRLSPLLSFLAFQSSPWVSGYGVFFFFLPPEMSVCPLKHITWAGSQEPVHSPAQSSAPADCCSAPSPPCQRKGPVAAACRGLPACHGLPVLLTERFPCSHPSPGARGPGLLAAGDTRGCLPPQCHRASAKVLSPGTMLDPALDHAEPSQVTTCCGMGLVRVGETLPEAAQQPPRLGWPWQG